MKKKILYLNLLMLFTAIVGTVAFLFLRKPFEVLVSPSGKYAVELHGDKQRPWWFSNSVTAKVYNESKLLIENEIHQGDAFDISFELAYQKYVWVDDDILSFQGIRNQEIEDNRNLSSLIINNKSNQEIRFLRVLFSKNMFLVLNLPPKSSRTVYANDFSSAKSAFIEGEFANKMEINSNWVYFRQNSENSNESLKYCASIENDKVTITDSFQIEDDKENPQNSIQVSKDCL